MLVASKSYPRNGLKKRLAIVLITVAIQIRTGTKATGINSGGADMMRIAEMVPSVNTVS
jgi:hypothetical protein